MTQSVHGYFMVLKYFCPLGVHNFQTLVTNISSLPISNKWMIWYFDSNLHIFMPKFQDYALTIEIRSLIKENLGVLGFRDNSEIPLSLQMITDIRQIELLLEEIEFYSTPDSLPIKLDRFEHHVKEASNHLHMSIHKLNSQLSDVLSENGSDLSSSLARLHFIQCQLDNVLVHTNRRKYNVITRVLALKSHHISFML